MAPPPVVVARNAANIPHDPAYTVAADSHRVENVEPSATHHCSPLRTISTSNVQNRRPKPVSRVESLTAQLEKLHIGDSHQVTPCKGKAAAETRAQPGARVARPPVTANTFVPLETVAEDEQADVPKPDPAAVSRGRPRYIELPVDRYAQHPLAIAARTSPSAAEQFAKQRNGDFDWVLTVEPPAASESSEGKKLFFGCNLLPVPVRSGDDAPSEEEPRSYTLLATPLEGKEEPVIDSPGAEETAMALAEAPQERLAPAKTGAGPLPAVKVEEYTPALVTARDGNDSSVPAVVFRVPAKEVEGIEAIDQFEEDMEAFELAAGIKTTASPSMGMRDTRSPEVPTLSPPVPRRDRTPAPQPERSIPTANASRTRSGRRPSSMILLDSPKIRGEDKALAQASPKKTPSKTLASLQPPKPLAPSPKAPTVAAFELPGEAVGRRLKEQREARRASQGAQPQPFQNGGDKVAHRLVEKREARLSAQFAEPKPHHPNAKRLSVLMTAIASPDQEDDNDDRSIPDSVFEEVWEKHKARLTPPTRSAHPELFKQTSSLRRAKSTKGPTLPKFELPGEAISRRKREEQEARRKAEEEEERRRRQFKAKPVRGAAAPSTAPRGTVASRARLNGTGSEKPAQQAPPSQNKRASMVMDTQPRGRHLTATRADQEGPKTSRATSSSASSTGKRSSVSLEEVQQQRVRGKDIFQRDSAFSQDRTKERREREAMARKAREEAAERSRQKSREWAEKQKRKRMTIGSLRDVAGARGL